VANKNVFINQTARLESMMKKSILFILTVDTEEEWDWNGPFPNENFSVKNIYELPAFQNFCQNLGIKPTYFIDYPVADDPNAIDIFKQFNSNYFEIGAHLHPWANPPFFNETSESSSHIINLPLNHVEQKLDKLLNKLEDNLNCTPTSFRSGRWGINGEILDLLYDKGINIDSSVYPLYKSEYFSCEQASNSPFWPSFNNTNQPGEQRDIFEIPVTVSFNRGDNIICQEIHKLFARKPFSWLRFNGILWHTKLLRKLYLCPELCTGNDMKMLIDTQLSKGQDVFHMYLHSSSLLENVTGLSCSENTREYLCQQIKIAVEHLAKKTDITFCTISEARNILTQRHK
jgi:hypothetical protein